MNPLKLFKKKPDVKKVAEEQLKENMSSIISLRDYDEGKKDIPTTELEKRLPDIRVSR